MTWWHLRRTGRTLSPALVALGILLAAASGPAAQQAPGSEIRPAATNPPDAELAAMLVRTTLIALHQANVTGNYTVLRDLGAPGFRDKNTAADLSLIFAQFRQQRIDLGEAVRLEPQLTRAGLDGQNMLQIAGTMATTPLPVRFELGFQSVNGVWRHFGISIGALQPAAAAPAPGR